MITVIMPNLNHGNFIKYAIQSCLNNNNLNEIIIADGGSTDNSISEISRFMRVDSRITFIESKDSGPAEALNKALNKSSSEIIGWLNSDDLYNDNVFDKVIFEFDRDKNLKFVYIFLAVIFGLASLDKTIAQKLVEDDSLTWQAGIEEQLQAQRQAYFINFTAAWCITCQANEQIALSRDSVKEFFNGIAKTLKSLGKAFPEVISNIFSFALKL